MKRAWIPAWAFWLMLLLPLCAGLAEATDGEAAYYGTIGKRMTVYSDASESAASLGKIEAGTVVDVYKKGRTWTRIGYESGQGYVLTKFVEMVQRKNQFAGPMPGTSKHVAVGYVLTDTLFTPEGYRYPISVSAGSWISVHRIKDGRAYFPYRRLEDDVSLGVDKLRMYDFVDWSEAKPGDLLYAFTTFYSTSTSKEGNVGRLYNIALASERLTGIRVKAVYEGKRLYGRADSFWREQDGLWRRRLSGVQHDLQHRSARARGDRGYELAFAGRRELSARRV